MPMGVLVPRASVVPQVPAGVPVPRVSWSDKCLCPQGCRSHECPGPTSACDRRGAGPMSVHGPTSACTHGAAGPTSIRRPTGACTHRAAGPTSVRDPTGARAHRGAGPTSVCGPTSACDRGGGRPTSALIPRVPVPRGVAVPRASVVPYVPVPAGMPVPRVPRSHARPCPVSGRPLAVATRHSTAPQRPLPAAAAAGSPRGGHSPRRGWLPRAGFKREAATLNPGSQRHSHSRRGAGASGRPGTRVKAWAGRAACKPEGDDSTEPKKELTPL